MKKYIKRLLSDPKAEKALQTLSDVSNNLLKVDVHYTDESVLIVSDDGVAVRVNSDTFVSIPNNQYVEVAKGVFDRVISGPDDIRFDFEKKYAKSVRALDFDKYIVIFVRFDWNANFPPHWHRKEERIYCLEGSYIGTIPEEKIFRSGDVQIVPPKVIHVFRAITEGYAVLTLKK
jgi:quercetin dioxygenase-like cupin family protein